MKKLNKYLAYVDNGKQTTSMALTATSKKSAMKALDGMGEVVALKNLNDEHPVKAGDIREALQASKKFDKLELDWIVHALTMTGIVTDGTEPQPEAKTDEDVLGNFWKKYEGTANSTQVCGITKRDNGFCVQYPTEFDANGDWKKENWRERWFATEAEAAQFAAEVPNSKADADEKILKAAMDYLEVSAQRMDNLDAMFRLMGLCENCGVSMVDAITVEKSIRRHFVKLYGADGRTAYRNFRMGESA